VPTPGYDKWKTTPPEPEVFTSCYQCGDDIYVGQEFVELEDGTKLCTESRCFDNYARDLLNPTTYNEDWS